MKNIHSEINKLLNTKYENLLKKYSLKLFQRDVNNALDQFLYAGKITGNNGIEIEIDMYKDLKNTTKCGPVNSITLPDDLSKFSYDLLEDISDILETENN